MLKEQRLKIIALRIEWHWLFIMRGRKVGGRITDCLIEKGRPLNTPGLMAVSRRLNRHCVKAVALTGDYLKLAGISRERGELRESGNIKAC